LVQVVFFGAQVESITSRGALPFREHVLYSTVHCFWQAVAQVAPALFVA
jgi:hypothetical protein